MLDPIMPAASLVATSRSIVSNVTVADKCEVALPRFEIERLDYMDPAGVRKRVLVAHKGPMGGGLGLSGHMDTVPAAATMLSDSVPITLLITTDEETTKQGAPNHRQSWSPSQRA